MSAKKAAKKKPEDLSAEEWKDIASHLYIQLKFILEKMSGAMGHQTVLIQGKGGAGMKMEPWQDGVIRALEKWPGVKIDREVAMALALPRKQRDKVLKEIEAERAKAKMNHANEQESR